jgi:hypothetical protein
VIIGNHSLSLNIRLFRREKQEEMVPRKSEQEKTLEQRTAENKALDLDWVRQVLTRRGVKGRDLPTEVGPGFYKKYSHLLYP